MIHVAARLAFIQLWSLGSTNAARLRVTLPAAAILDATA